MDLSYALSFITRHHKLLKKLNEEKVSQPIKHPIFPRREIGTVGDGWEDVFVRY
jgi:hypothetical protein